MEGDCAGAVFASLPTAATPGIRMCQVFDQSSLGLSASALGVSEAVCGYVATILAFELAKRPRPRTAKEVREMETELQANGGCLIANALDSAVERVRARRAAYADSHPEEFAPEGSEYEASKDSAGRGRMARSGYMKALCSITDVQWLLDTMSAEFAPPLLRNVQACCEWPDGTRETHAEIRDSFPTEEDRDAVATEEPFTLGSRLVGLRLALGETAGFKVPPHFHGAVKVDAFSSEEAKFSVLADGVAEALWVPESALRPMFAQCGSGVALSLEEAAERCRWREREHCCPWVIETLGHFDVALPLTLDGDASLLVLESMDNPVSVQHKVLAAALHGGRSSEWL